MSKVSDYRRAMDRLHPSPAWRARTLGAMEAAQRRPARHPVRRAVVAAVCAAAFVGGLWGGLSQTEQVRPAQTPGVARTPAPAATLSPEELWSLPDASGWITIVEDAGQQMGSNPTTGRLDELTELPVYPNAIATGEDPVERVHPLTDLPTSPDPIATEENQVDRVHPMTGLPASPDPAAAEEDQMERINQLAEGLGLTLDTYTMEPSGSPNVSSLAALCQDGSQLLLHNLDNLTVTFAQPPESLTGLLFSFYTGTGDAAPWRVETLEDYNFDGSRNSSQTWYYDDPDPDSPPELQLYFYSFHRFRLSGSDTAHLVLPPASSWNCPIRTAEEAVALFRSGDYWSTMETAYPERAEILQVTLEYATQPYQEYFQPVYRILFTQDYWADYLSAWMDEEVDASHYLGVAVAYVPAVEGLNFRLYANDTELHRTPD